MSYTPEILARITYLHTAWNGATGQDLRLRMFDYEREYGYQQFIKAGFTDKDMLTVVTYLQREIKKGNRLPGALRWSNCIGNLTRFEEDLSMARAEHRNAKPQPTAKQRVLQQARPTIVPMTPEQSQNTAQPISVYIEALRKAAQ